MLELTDMLQNAKEFAYSLNSKFIKQHDCLSFMAILSMTSFQKDVIKDALVISVIADSLDIGRDKELLEFYKNRCNFKGTIDDLKQRIIFGSYLLIWSRYHGSFSNMMNSDIIELIQTHIHVKNPKEIAVDDFDESLNILRNYSSFVYEYKETNPVFSDVNRRLGENIQSEILDLQQSKMQEEHVFLKTYNEIRLYWGYNPIG